MRVGVGVGALSLLLLGCELTASIGAYPNESMESTQTGSSSSEGGSETGGGSGSDSETDTGWGETWGDGDGDGDGDSCAIDESQTPCEVCLAELCCGQLAVCLASPGCVCMLECTKHAPPQFCGPQCQPSFGYFELSQCRAIQCGSVCF